MRYVRYRIEPRLSEILGMLDDSALGQSLADRLTQLVRDAGPTPTGVELESAVAPAQWLLDRAADGGISLTAAGYLKPADVKALAKVLPTMQEWIFPVTREINAQPVGGFRVFVQRAGLLRKYKGSLLLTRAGNHLRKDSAALWDHLADKLIPDRPAFDATATVLVLLHFATSLGERVNTSAIALAMQQLGWAHADGGQVTAADVQWVVNDVWNAIGNIGPTASSDPLDRTPSAAAISLIRDALLTESP